MLKHRDSTLCNPGTRVAHCASCLIITCLIAVSPGIASAAQDGTGSNPSDPVTAAFFGHDPQSDIELNHAMWSRLLSKTVVFAGRSTTRLGRGDKQSWVGSRMGFGNDLPSRYENNRVVLSGFDDEHVGLIRRYRQALEAVPAQIPLTSLSRAEQLAYWLNLYNAHALEHVAKHYPDTTTKALRSAPGEPPEGIWHERTLEVAGMALSLVDIEQKILFPIWDDPLVLYGLWQGAIGGPRLPGRAYTASEIHRMLVENAREFINSNRGMKPAGRVLEVSLIYGWGAPLFDGRESLKRHIGAYARPPFAQGLEAATDIAVNLYDWHLADLSGGTHHQGQWNHTAAFVFGLPNDHGNIQLGNLAMRTDTTRRSMPAPTIELLQQMRRFNNLDRETRVGIRDCSSTRDCERPEEAGGK